MSALLHMSILNAAVPQDGRTRCCRGLMGWALGLVLLVGCSSRTEVAPVSLSFELVARDAGAAQVTTTRSATPAYRVFQEASAWESHWHQDLARTTSMVINFATEFVLCVYMGEKPTGGYAIAITDMELRDGVVHVTLEETEPAADAMLIQVITSPYAIYRVNLKEASLSSDDNMSFRFRSPRDGSPVPVTLERLPTHSHQKTLGMTDDTKN